MRLQRLGHSSSWFAFAAALIMLGAACTSSANEASGDGKDPVTASGETTPQTTVVGAENPTTTETASNDESNEFETRTLGTYDYAGVRRVYVLIPPGLEDADLVAIATELREQTNADPANDGLGFVTHWLMDDDSEFDTLFAELPNTRAGDSSRWPEQYVIDHTVAVNDGYFAPNDDGGADRFYWLCRFYETCDADTALAIYPA